MGKLVSMTIEKRQLGRTGIEVTPIGLGAWQFSEAWNFQRFFWGALPMGEVDGIVKEALAGGINWVDTAELYGKGRSERGLSRALEAAGKANGEVVVATKWSPLFRTAASITNTIEERIACLAPFAIDLHQVHAPVSFSSIEKQMDAMADLLEAGKIRSIGVSNFSAEQMRRAHKRLVERGFVLASNQVKYNVMARDIERNGVLAAAKALGITIIAYSPLEMGLLTGKFHNDPNLLKSRPLFRRLSMSRQIEKTRPLITGLSEIAKTHNVSVSQVALNWLINFHGEIVVAIPGATKVRHAQESAGAMKFSLTKEEMARIDELSG